MARHWSFHLPTFLLFGAVLVSTFVLAVFWEFWGEGWLFNLLGNAQEDQTASVGTLYLPPLPSCCCLYRYPWH